jgi:hypothetical protein
MQFFSIQTTKEAAELEKNFPTPEELPNPKTARTRHSRLTPNIAICATENVEQFV